MFAQIRSELLKLSSVRTSWIFSLATAALVVFVVLAQALSAGSEIMGPLTDEATQLALFRTAAIAPLVAIVFGCLVLTSELRHHTIVSTLLVDANRARVVIAKAIATLAAGAALGAAAVAVGLGASVLTLLTTGTAFAVDVSEVVSTSGGTIAAAALGALFGLGIGGMVRNQALAVGAVLVLMLAIEPLIGSLLPDVAEWLPSSLVTIVGEGRTGGDVAFGVAAGALAAYALATTVGAAVTLQSSDIT